MLRTLPFALALAALSIFATSCGSSSSKLRLVHVVPDGGAIDVLIDGKNVAPGLSFDSASSYLSVASGSRHVQLFAAGTTTSPYFDGTVSVSSGTTYTAVATGSAVQQTVVAPLFTDNNAAPTSNNAELRIVQASPTGLGAANGAVDIYVTSPGGGINGSPSIANVAYPTASTYLSVPAGTYDILVTPAGIQAIDLRFSNAAFTAGKIYTYVLFDAQVGQISTTPLILNDN
jgi:hypothetical protein